MTTSYDFKLIASGKEIETYQYLDKSVYKGFKRRKRKRKQPMKEQEKIESSSLYRTRIKIRRLINSNTQLNKFLTLTHNKEIFDLKISNYMFNLFTQRITDKFPEFKYLAVPEFQKKSKRVHYHLLCNLPYIDSNKIASIWKNGYIKINRIDRVNNIGKYICKYLNKDMCDIRLFHKKKFFYSQDLKTSFELFGSTALNYFDEVCKNILPFSTAMFENKYLGKIIYKTYMLESEPKQPEIIFKKSIIQTREKNMIDFINKADYN